MFLYSSLVQSSVMLHDVTWLYIVIVLIFYVTLCSITSEFLAHDLFLEPRFLENQTNIAVENIAHDVMLFQDGCVLCSWAGWHQRAPPPQLHVLSVLGCHGHQRAPRESLQGLQVQQLLHGSAAPHPLPQSITCRLHHHDPAAFIWLRTLQVATHTTEVKQHIL